MSIVSPSPAAGSAARRLSRAALESQAAAMLARSAVLILVSAMVTVVPLLLHPVSRWLAVLTAFGFAMGVAISAPRVLPSAILFNAMFQTLIVSILSPLVETVDDLAFVRGYGFMVTVGFWVVVAVRFVLEANTYPPRVRSTVFVSIGVLAVIGAYMVLGLPANGQPAIIYTRNFSLPILLFQICLLTAARERVDFGRSLMVFGSIYVVLGYIEFFFRDAWLRLTNGVAYWTLQVEPLRQTGAFIHTLKTTGRVVKDITDTFSVDLFNTSLLADFGISIDRLFGPNIHAISYGYCLAFLFLYLLAAGRRTLALVLLPLIVFASAKGAIVLILMVLGGWWATRLLGAWPGLLTVCGVLGVYIVGVVVSGLGSGDYHVLGLMGGLYGFLGRPIGFGIGSGGNLDAQMTPEQWQTAQHVGYTPYAIESSIGVLIYQMGVGSFAVLAFYGLLSFMTWKLYIRRLNRHYGLAAFGTLTVLVNGLFQEEALFSVLAMGLTASYVGVVLGSAWRSDPSARP